MHGLKIRGIADIIYLQFRNQIICHRTNFPIVFFSSTISGSSCCFFVSCFNSVNFASVADCSATNRLSIIRFLSGITSNGGGTRFSCTGFAGVSGCITNNSFPTELRRIRRVPSGNLTNINSCTIFSTTPMDPCEFFNCCPAVTTVFLSLPKSI